LTEQTESRRGSNINRTPCASTHMLLFGGLFGAVMTVWLFSRLRRSAQVRSRDLGWVSERWQAEQRASHQR
jgi:hypothetical protein